MGIIGKNCKAKTEDLKEVFLQKNHPKLEKQYISQRCFLKNKPMGKDDWTPDPVGDVCSFTANRKSLVS